MDNFFNICIALSFAIAFGGAAGVLTNSLKQKNSTDKQKEKGKKLWKIGSRFMTYLTCLFLALGFIWCVYFLVLGIVHPEQLEYANNLSEMIVSVLTVVSIAFAFYEFLRKR